MYEFSVCHSYINELQEKFSNINFTRLEKIKDIYVTNHENRSTRNDSRIFAETQVKRMLRSSLSPWVPQSVKRKLSYFYQEEDKDTYKIYKFDDCKNLLSEEEYAIQYIGHATLLIQIPGFNILTDPVFYDLNNVFYPAKTASHKSITELPQIDVILISHNHRDHIDQDSLQELLTHHKQKRWPEPKIFVPMGDKRLLESFGFGQVEEVEWYTKISITSNAERTVNFISIPADHRSGRSVFDHHKSLVTGWIVNPQQEAVIFKYSGDTRSLTDDSQQSIDAVLWNEIKSKKVDQSNESVEVPDIICFEPSGPNYTRCDMDVTHQSTSYSVLLKFTQAGNLSKLSNKSFKEFIQKIKTVMIHHNKFELGPDRFNEGLFVFKKLYEYLRLNKTDLDVEYTRQKEKLACSLDRKKLKENTPFTSRPILATLPKQTSLMVHAKDFIIEEINDIMIKLGSSDKKAYLIGYILKNTVFPKIGERLNKEQIVSLVFNVQSIQKYSGKNFNL